MNSIWSFEQYITMTDVTDLPYMFQAGRHETCEVKYFKERIQSKSCSNFY